MKVKQQTNEGQGHAECTNCDWVSAPDGLQDHLDKVQRMAKRHARKTGHETIVGRSVWTHYTPHNN